MAGQVSLGKSRAACVNLKVSFDNFLVIGQRRVPDVDAKFRHAIALLGPSFFEEVSISNSLLKFLD